MWIRCLRLAKRRQHRAGSKASFSEFQNEMDREPTKSFALSDGESPTRLSGFAGFDEQICGFYLISGSGVPYSSQVGGHAHAPAASFRNAQARKSHQNY